MTVNLYTIKANGHMSYNILVLDVIPYTILNGLSFDVKLELSQ
nr:MAG TPA: hypothetical protein [Caudoviricetes sp.]